MDDHDLIRRGDALALLPPASAYRAAIAALPAVKPAVKPLEWEVTDWSAGDGVQGENDCEWEARVSDWRYMVEWRGRGEFRVTMPDDTDASAQSLEAAKAAAQADYEARILAALDVQPAPVAPEVAALVEAVREIMRHRPDYAPTAWDDLEEAFAATEARPNG